MRAVRIEVSTRQPQRSQPTRPSPAGRSRSSSLRSASYHRLESADPGLETGDELAPQTGDQQQPHGDQHGSSDPRDELGVSAHRLERVERLAVGEPGRHERQPEPEGVAEREQRPLAALPWSTDRVSTTASVGPMHGVQPSPNTIPSSGAPASPAAAQLVDAEVALQPRDDPDEGQPEHDRDDAEHRVITSALPSSTAPSPPNSAPPSTNTRANPSTNSSDPQHQPPPAGSALMPVT